MTFSQNTFIVNDSIHGGYSISFMDTLVSTGGQESNTYQIDLDNNGSIDLKFNISNYTGSNTTTRSTSIYSYDNFSIVLDSSYQENGTFTNDSCVLYAEDYLTTVPKLFNDNDSVFVNEYADSTASNSYYLKSIYNSFCNVTDATIAPFNGFGNLVLYKLRDSVTYIYTIELRIRGEELVLKSARTNDPFVIIAFDPIPNYQQRVYPNPFIQEILIDGNFKLLEVFSLTGELVASKLVTGTSHVLNLKEISSGVYYLKMSNGDLSVVKKIVKE